MSLTMSAKLFSLSSPSVCKSLPYNCRSTMTVSAFKRALKRNFLPYLTVATGPSFPFHEPTIRY